MFFVNVRKGTQKIEIKLNDENQRLLRRGVLRGAVADKYGMKNRKKGMYLYLFICMYLFVCIAFVCIIFVCVIFVCVICTDLSDKLAEDTVNFLEKRDAANFDGETYSCMLTESQGM